MAVMTCMVIQNNMYHLKEVRASKKLFADVKIILKVYKPKVTPCFGPLNDVMSY